jgi:putative transposase
MYNYRKLTAKEKAEQIEQRLKNGYPPHSPPHPIVNELKHYY